MVKCDKCGQNLTRNVKFCSNCGDAITWPEVDGQSPVNRVDEFVKERGTEIVHDNIPDEYIDKIKENISNYQEIRNDPERSIIDENDAQRASAYGHQHQDNDIQRFPVFRL